MADGVGGLSAAVLLFAAVIWMWLPEATVAQETTVLTTVNASNVTVVPCNTQCCDSQALMVESRLACQEFRNWGIQDSLCSVWQMNAKRACVSSCSNCTEISKAMYDQCLFFLQRHMEFTSAMQYCKTVEEDFKSGGRCNSMCNTTVDDCFQPKALKCMAKCGNYQECECWKWRGSGAESDQCDGKTVIEGYIPGREPPKRYSCSDINATCKNHRGLTGIGEANECGQYKWCQTNMCLVKDVTCTLTDDCQKSGACETSSGDCYYTYRDDGTLCTDGKFYTHNDVCVSGKCTGWVDRCLRDDVKCGTRNPCLTNGTCHQVTGACVFQRKGYNELTGIQDRVQCPSAPGEPFDGTCQDGICRRDNLDRCDPSHPYWKNCSLLAGPCFKTPICDPYTGNCIVEHAPEGKQCSDDNKKTTKDICIEGQCVGHQFESPHFLKIGDGFCANEQGNMLQRYYADVFDEDECRGQCADDPACVAYSFGFHFCSIYGGTRTKHPSMSFHGAEYWILGSLQGDIAVNASEAKGVAEPKPDQQKLVCMAKVNFVEAEVVETPIEHEVAFGILILVIVCSPAIHLGLWKLRQHPEEDDEDYGGSSHQDSAAIENLRFLEHLKASGGDILSLHALPGETSVLSLRHTGKGEDGPALSPRDGNAAAVAMAPDSLQDEPPDDTADAGGEDKKEADDQEANPALDDSDVRDPRGAVDELGKAVAGAPAT